MDVYGRYIELVNGIHKPENWKHDWRGTTLQRYVFHCFLSMGSSTLSSTWKRPPFGVGWHRKPGKLATSAAFSPRDASNVSHFFRLLEVKRPVRLKKHRTKKSVVWAISLAKYQHLSTMFGAMVKMAKNIFLHPAHMCRWFLIWMIHLHTIRNPISSVKTSTTSAQPGRNRCPGRPGCPGCPGRRRGPQPMLSNRLLMADSTTQSWSSKATCLGYSGSNMVQKWWRSHGICWWIGR